MRSAASRISASGRLMRLEKRYASGSIRAKTARDASHNDVVSVDMAERISLSGLSISTAPIVCPSTCTGTPTMSMSTREFPLSMRTVVWLTELSVSPASTCAASALKSDISEA